MRKPSPRCFPNVVALYRYTPRRKPDGGVAADPYTLITPLASCAVQPSQPERAFDGEVLKPVEKGSGALLFPTDPGLGLNDKAVWIDSAGVVHQLYITGVADQAGRGALFELSYQERLA